MVDPSTEGRIKSLSSKGFNKKEIAKLLKIKEEKINIKEVDIKEASENLYSELQKDLSKLVLTEMGKKDRDTSIILNAIKLQSELQEKKLHLNRSFGSSKINKNYIYERDEEIFKLNKSGIPIGKIAKKMNVSILSVKQSLDRTNLNLPNELKELSPTIISETIGLDKKTRIKILENAYKDSLTREEIRRIVNEIKNKSR